MNRRQALRAAVAAGAGPAQEHTDPPARAVVRNTLSAVGDSSIVSLHLDHRATIAAMGSVLDGLHSRRRAVTMTDLVTA